MLGRLTSTNRSRGCCLAAFLMGWAVTAPPELSPADGDGPSPAWTVHPPGSVAPFAPGPGSSSGVSGPAFGATWLLGTRCGLDLDLRYRPRTCGGLFKKARPPHLLLAGAGGVPSALPGVI